MKDLIQKARKANLAEYLIKLGQPLKKDGQRYRHMEHDSLIFTDGFGYIWNSKNETGNAIDFLVRHMNMDFKTAVYELTNNFKNAEQEKKEGTVRTSPNYGVNRNRAIAYLCQNRLIDYKIVTWLIKNNLLHQENKTNNIVFSMLDEYNLIVGAELCGTLSNKRFKGISHNSKYGYGFGIYPPDKTKIQYILFFESAIDLLSYIDIKKIDLDATKLAFVSMGGLKLAVIKNMIKIVPSTAVLCVDNDDAGVRFVKDVTDIFPDILTKLPDPNFKDWNEQLKELKLNK